MKALMILLALTLVLTACSEQNMAAEAAKTDNYKSDLYIQRMSWSPQDPMVGEQVTFSVVVANRGNYKSYPSTLGFRDSLANKQGTVFNVPALKSDETFEVTTTVAYSKKSTEIVTAIADLYETNGESNEENNVAKNTLTIR